jgi:hypothetical protein
MKMSFSCLKYWTRLTKVKDESSYTNIYSLFLFIKNKGYPEILEKEERILADIKF